MTQNKTVVVGMSGGVDSSVAALLLKQQGYNVIGLFMRNWEEEDASGHCTAEEDYEDVKRVCNKLDIPYYTVNFSKEYMDKVFDNFLEEYKKGRTPNPDVLCNREIKFGPFLDYAKKIGADFIATGHYARVKTENGHTYLLKGVDDNKDQTYFLNQLNEEQLSKTLFPVGHLTKPELRIIAKEYGFVTAEKKDSTGICFIGERKFRDFLKNYLPAKPGVIKDLQGNTIGKHEGLMYYTLGQRRGLNIGGLKGGSGERFFVIKKDMENNILFVNQGDHEELYSNGLIMHEMHWINGTPKQKQFECTAKFRHRQPDQQVTVELLDSGYVKLTFKQKQRAITEGQWAVLYNNDICLGGGVIEEKI
ncbi:MAG: tRNA 2-thiouridine(34) synthase MnmA [Tenericutes bacterium HGW-Tenericutes-4]|jgi:tRNA-specific 2-thiouridylase|nr:MAG: tRNA 2-thiouridine(34) synthase MnmA [Tenericutes bacterium HGW-Tenericutes-4]